MNIFTHNSLIINGKLLNEKQMSGQILEWRIYIVQYFIQYYTDFIQTYCVISTIMKWQNWINGCLLYCYCVNQFPHLKFDSTSFAALSESVRLWKKIPRCCHYLLPKIIDKNPRIWIKSTVQLISMLPQVQRKWFTDVGQLKTTYFPLKYCKETKQ